MDLSKQKKLAKIKKGAFNGCKKLKNLKISAKSLKKVDKKAFKGCANKKSTKVTVFASNRSKYKKAVKILKKAGLSKATFKFKKQK